jgi:ribokinase
MSIEVIGLGALNVDHIYLVEQILVDGESQVEEFALFPGGSAANTIYGLAKLGVKTGFIGLVGDDEESKLLLESFRSVGVDTSQIGVRQGAKTGSVLCLSDKQGKRALYTMPAANSLLSEEDVKLDYINQAKFLHLSTFAKGRGFEIQTNLMSELNSSVKVSFAPGSIYTAFGIQALTPILQRSYVLFINQNEMGKLTGKNISVGARICLERGCRIVVVTLGEGIYDGGKKIACYIYEGEDEYKIEAETAPTVKDTIGAGDAFAAGFLSGLLRERELEECGHLGDFMARLCISEVGARIVTITNSQL